MSRNRQPYGGPKLPRSIIDQVGGADVPRSRRTNGAGKNNHAVNTRKEQRKLARQSKARGTSDRIRSQSPAEQNLPDIQSHESKPTNGSLKNDASTGKKRSSKSPRSAKFVKEDFDIPDSSEADHQDSTSLPSSLSVPRQSVQKLAVDDAEISALEKRLGIKNKALPQSFYTDGLGNIFEGFEGEADSDDEQLPHKRKRQVDDEWLQHKRHKYEAADSMELEDSHEDDLEDDNTSASDSEGESDQSSEQHDDSFEFDGNESADERPIVKKRQRENPYVAPVTDAEQASAKYVPPARRMASADDAELNRRLQKQLQGLLNRLSDSNLYSIVKEVEALYRVNPRQYVTSTMVQLLLNLIGDRTSLNDTLIVLHAGFITALYKVIGPDFGAQMIEGVVSKLEESYVVFKNDSGSNKEYLNFMSLAAQLFNFGVITSDLIFDYLRILLEVLNESNTEGVLRIVRISGTQLRQDDPSSLKDIVQLLQQNVTAAQEGSLSVRTKFMIEIISDLKNNRMKSGGANSSIVSDYAAQIKRNLGPINNIANIKATEPMRLTLEDIRTADKQGKWWLIGASWKGRNQNLPLNTKTNSEKAVKASAAHNANDNSENLDESSDDDPANGVHLEQQDLSRLAATNGMNTPLRRQIFAILVTSTDYQQACNNLLKLPITKKQRTEIPRVLIRCVAQEKVYNHYYTLIARQLCSNKRERSWRVFCLSLRGLLRSLHIAKADNYHADEDEEDGDSQVPFSSFEMGDQSGRSKLAMRVNFARFYGTLIADGALDIRELKDVKFKALSSRNLAETSSKRSAGVAFLELLLITIILQAPRTRPKSTTVELDGPVQKTGDRNLEFVFASALGLPSLHTGLTLFVRRVVRPSDLVSNDKERKRLKQGCRLVSEVLARGTGEDAESIDELS